MQRLLAIREWEAPHVMIRPCVNVRASRMQEERRSFFGS